MKPSDAITRTAPMREILALIIIEIIIEITIVALGIVGAIVIVKEIM